jgi:pantetheine-phosphate adenylyltransferase
MKTAICPGSFDPVTYGHLDIFRRASRLFDEVIVLVMVNIDKNPSFTADERIEMIREVTQDIPNIRVESYDGLLIDYVKQVGACAIVKGLRAVSDFEYEFQMALTNKTLYHGAETVFLTTSVYNMYVSSSLVKTIARFGGDIHRLVPEVLQDRILARLHVDDSGKDKEAGVT